MYVYFSHVFIGVQVVPTLVIVIVHVGAGGDVIHPLLVIEIPADGLFDAFIEL